MPTREEYNRDYGRGPLGGSTSSASPDNNSVPIRTRCPAGANTACSFDMQKGVENYNIAQAEISSSKNCIKLYKMVLVDEITLTDAKAKMVTIGNAAVGVTEEGKKLPLIIQRAVAEVETLQFSEEGRQGWSLLSVVTGDLASIEKQIATNEIERQRHFIKILERDHKDPRPRPDTQLSRVLSILRNPIGF